MTSSLGHQGLDLLRRFRVPFHDEVENRGLVEVFRGAVRAAAAAIVLVHNRPSGDPSPSAEDRSVTQRLAESGRLLGIEVLDHVVVARGGHFSFRAAGELGAPAP